MKKIILITAILLITNIGIGQFVLLQNKTDGKYSTFTNTGTYQGISANNLFGAVHISAVNQIDTSIWVFIRNATDGRYSAVQNKKSYLGIDSGKIKIPIIYDVNGISLSGNNTWSGINIFDSLINNTAIMSVSYSELSSLINSSNLIKGQYYIINDFATKHYFLDGERTINDAINTGTTEPLIIQAVSNNQISNQAISLLYPDDLILYDYNPSNWTSDISFSFNGTIINGFKGVIYYRKDVKNGIETYYDWRNVKIRRWKIEPPEYSAGTTYSKYNIVQSSGKVYYSVINSNTGNSTSDRSKWRYILDYNTATNPYLLWADTVIRYGFVPEDQAVYQFKLTSATYIDTTTFTNNAKNISIGRRQANTIINNITFHTSGLLSDITLEDLCWESSLTMNDLYYGKFGRYFYHNIIAGGTVDDANVIEGCFENTIGSNFRKNTIQVDFAQNLIASNFAKNHIQVGFEFNYIGFRFVNNDIGSEFQYNYVGDTCLQNQIGSAFTNNIIKGQFYYNTIGYYFYNNSVDRYFQYNTVAGGFASNTIGEYCNDNFFGSNIRSNTIGSGVQYNILPAYTPNNSTIPTNRRWAQYIGDASNNHYYWKILNNIMHLYNDNSTQIFSIDSTSNVFLKNGGYLYLVGDATTNGSWRIRATQSGNCVIEVRNSGSWEAKQTLIP